MFAFFIFFIGVMIGVFILIIYLNYPEEKSGTINNGSTGGNSNEGSSEITAINNQGVPMPQVFDMNFFQKKILEVRNSETIVQAYIQTWTTKFMGNQERKVLEEIRRWANVIKEVEDAQAEALLAKIKKQDILEEQEPLFKDKDIEIRLLRLQNEIEILNADIAETKKRRRAAEREEETKTAEPEQKKVKKKITPEQKREIENKWDKVQYADMLAKATTAIEAFTMVDIQEKEAVNKIKEMGLPPEEEKEEIRRAKIVFSRLRLDISKKYGQGRG